MRTPKEPGTEAVVRAAAAPASMPFAEMEALAQAIAKSQLFGIKTPEQAIVLMAISQAEGRHPALAARDYDIIQGRPAKKAEAMLRDFLASGGRVEWHQIDDDAADATFSHPQGGEARIKWDMARVKKARISNAEMYTKYPRAMLRSRVVSEGVRTVCPAATGGFFVGEEAADIEPREPIDVTPKAELDEFAAESPVEAHKRIYADAEAHFAEDRKRHRLPPEREADVIAALSTPTSVKYATEVQAEDTAERETRAAIAAATEAEEAAAITLLQEAEGAARLGLEGFRSWWRTLNAAERATVEPHLDRLEKLVQAPKRVTIQDQPTQHHVVEAAQQPGAAAPEPQPAAPVDPPQPPQVFSFANQHGEIFEFDSVLDAVSALMMALDDVTDAASLAAIWKSAANLREIVRGNGNLGAELDGAYVRAVTRVTAPGRLDEEARKAAAGGMRKFHGWWLRLEPEQRKELAAKRTEYEELARGAKT